MSLHTTSTPLRVAPRHAVNAIPGPPAPLGLASQLGRMTAFFRDPISTLRHYHATYGPLSRLVDHNYAALPDLVFALGPDYNRAILSQPDLFHSSAMLDIKHDAITRLTAGLTFLNGPAHKEKRQLVMPLFHRRTITAYRDAIVALTEDMLARWQSGDVRDVAAAMQTLTAQIALRALFGLETVEAGARLHELIEVWMQLATSPLLRALPVNAPGLPRWRLRQVSTALEGELRALIDQKRDHPEQYDDLLALLLQTRTEDGHALTEDEIIGQVNVLFLAGHETSGNALAWTLFLLAQHPAVLADLRDELAAVLGGDAPTMQQLGELPLLDRVIKESLRLLPPVVWIQRIAQPGAALDGIGLPPGTVTLLSHFITHHLPELYDQPERFLPERWERINPGPYAYLPFSAGPRMCIGASFAQMELKLVLALIVQRAGLELAPGARIDRRVTVTLTPRHGLPMRVLPPGARVAAGSVRGDINELVDLA